MDRRGSGSRSFRGSNEEEYRLDAVIVVFSRNYLCVFNSNGMCKKHGRIFVNTMLASRKLQAYFETRLLEYLMTLIIRQMSNVRLLLDTPSRSFTTCLLHWTSE